MWWPRRRMVELHESGIYSFICERKVVSCREPLPERPRGIASTCLSATVSRTYGLRFLGAASVQV